MCRSPVLVWSPVHLITRVRGLDPSPGLVLPTAAFHTSPSQAVSPLKRLERRLSVLRVPGSSPAHDPCVGAAVEMIRVLRRKARHIRRAKQSGSHRAGGGTLCRGPSNGETSPWQHPFNPSTEGSAAKPEHDGTRGARWEGRDGPAGQSRRWVDYSRGRRLQGFGVTAWPPPTGEPALAPGGRVPIVQLLGQLSRLPQCGATPTPAQPLSCRGQK